MGSKYDVKGSDKVFIRIVTVALLLWTISLIFHPLKPDPFARHYASETKKKLEFRGTYYSYSKLPTNPIYFALVKLDTFNYQGQYIHTNIEDNFPNSRTINYSLVVFDSIIACKMPMDKILDMKDGGLVYSLMGDSLIYFESDNGFFSY